MPKLSLVDPAPPVTADAVVIGVIKDGDGVRLAPGADAVDAALNGTLAAALDAAGATGKVDEVVKIPTLGLAKFPLVVAAGARARDPDDEALRRGVGAALRGLDRQAHGARRDRRTGRPRWPRAPTSARTPTPSTSRSRRRTGCARSRSASRADKDGKAELRRVAAVTDAIRFVRDLVNTPPNDLYPQTFAERVEERAGRATA